MRVFASLLLVAAMTTTTWADDAKPLKLVSVAKIWDRGGHNAFTDLIRFQGKWYCSFREGAGHALGAGACRVLESTDGEAWKSVALIELDDIDLRDPKLSIAPDGRLMMVGGAAVPAKRNPLKDHYSFVSFSKDGSTWSKPQRVIRSWQWLWRVTWHKGTAYGVAYGWDSDKPSDPKQYTATIYKSTDGLDWSKLADSKLPNATEASLAFQGDEMICLLRRDGKPNSAQLGRSQSPYTDWHWKDLGIFFGGPQLTQAPDGTWWACGRLLKDEVRTAVCQLDIDKGTLTPVLRLPSAGDTSYPGMVWHEGVLWISYYSQHENKKASIFLAKVQPNR
jgi:hypothetical protein